MNSFKEKVLYNLNIKEEDLPSLFKDPTYKDIEDPYCFSDMEKCVNRIKVAIENKENVMIYGDYDCDGITSTSIMVYTFKKLGLKVGYYIPSRYIDGYGLQMKRCEQIVSKNYNLVITVDNGVSCPEQIKYLKEHNVDVIVTDHHEMTQELPEDQIIVHPSRKNTNCDLKQCGAYVAFMVSIALLGKIDPYLLSLASIATVSDMMPLKGYNRDLLKLGLKEINSHPDYPIHSLTDETEINEETLGFSICPKINAVGRVKEDLSVNDLVRFLVSEDKRIVFKIVNEIEQANVERKMIISDYTKKIDFSAFENDKIVITCFDDALEGIIGLLAVKIMGEVKKPVFVFTKSKDGILKGSARSFGDLDLTKLLVECSSTLYEYGGHAQAAGVSVKEENYEAFKQMALNYSKNYEIVYPKQDYILLSKDEVNFDNYSFLQKLSPFGIEYPRPFFGLNINKYDVNVAGQNQNHIRGAINSNASFIGYNLYEEVKFKDSFIAVGILSYDTFRKGKNISFKISNVI